MLVMRPIRRTSPWAMKPVATARTMDHAQMTSTRESMAGFSRGTRDGATSLVIVRLLPATAAAGFGPVVVLEEHRCRSWLGAECVDEGGEGVGKTFSIRRGAGFA